MRVLAINDVSCVGKCSLTVALPIVSACGIECTVLPTALLSTHTGGFTGYTFRDLTDDIPAILNHWESLGLKFEYICSGFLGSIQQIDLVADVKKRFLADGGKFVVDPVMGDGGKLYAGFTPDYVEKMRGLCREADYILPNVTEACYLADMPYPLTQSDAGEVLNRLKKLCKQPIVTGIVEGKNIAVNYVNGNGTARVYAHENIEGFFHGAGDVFAAAFIGCLARGKTEDEAIKLSSDFVTASIRRTEIEVEDRRYGLNFEAETFAFLQALNEK